MFFVISSVRFHILNQPYRLPFGYFEHVAGIERYCSACLLPLQPHGYILDELHINDLRFLFILKKMAASSFFSSWLSELFRNTFLPSKKSRA